MNSPDVTIENIHLQLEKSAHIEGKVVITITLKNRSKTRTNYVLKRPRNIDYDQGSHTLFVDLYEKEQSPGSSPFEPEQIAILPDTTLQWRYLLPVWMKKITRSPGLREVVEVLDISGVQNVACTVAYHTSPFRARPSGDQESLTLSEWGVTVSATFERTLI